ncbi:protein of unknown function [Methylocaldum szegediense]|uniref:Uncharacterized protein n=1 Tax=Methylocaldum szegediense TaxID=73780 RepID=A0ABM9HYM6_9GAMM|nr:protein of unknown function [Methylocaldum szegediense]
MVKKGKPRKPLFTLGQIGTSVDLHAGIPLGAPHREYAE